MQIFCFTATATILQDEILPGSELSLNPNAILAQIVIDGTTIWPDVSGSNPAPSSEDQFEIERKNYSCVTCDKLYPEEPIFHDNPSIMSSLLSCVVCGKSYLNIVELYLHFKLGHADEKCPLLIEEKALCECKKIQEQPQDPQIKTKKVKKVRFKVQCDFCAKEFRCKENLQKHIEAVHLEAKKTTCNICDKAFARKYDCDVHMRKVHAKITRFESGTALIWES